MTALSKKRHGEFVRPAFVMFSAILFASTGPILAQSTYPSGPPAVVGASANCELHIFPTGRYRASGSTGLSLIPGLGVLAAGVAAAADAASYSGSVSAADRQLSEFLGAKDQVAVLKEAGVLAALRLPDDTIIIEERPTPTADEAKEDPVLEVLRKDRQSKTSARLRLSSSAAPCYRELIVRALSYTKSPLNARLWSAFSYREFSETPKAERVVELGIIGANPGRFPATQPDQLEFARLDIKKAFEKDFTGWTTAKLKTKQKASGA